MSTPDDDVSPGMRRLIRQQVAEIRELPAAEREELLRRLREGELSRDTVLPGVPKPQEEPPHIPQARTITGVSPVPFYIVYAALFFELGYFYAEFHSTGHWFGLSQVLTVVVTAVVLGALGTFRRRSRHVK